MKERIRSQIETLLSKEYHCDPEILNGKETVFTIRPDSGKPYIKIMAYRNCVVVCSSDGSSEYHEIVKRLAFLE